MLVKVVDVGSLDFCGQGSDRLHQVGNVVLGRATVNHQDVVCVGILDLDKPEKGKMILLEEDET